MNNKHTPEHKCNCSPDNHSCGDACSCHSNTDHSSSSSHSHNQKGFTIAFENNQVHTCTLLATIDIDDITYVILQHPEENQQLLYRYSESDGNIQLEEIYDEEFDLVARAYGSTL